MLKRIIAAQGVVIVCFVGVVLILLLWAFISPMSLAYISMLVSRETISAKLGLSQPYVEITSELLPKSPHLAEYDQYLTVKTPKQTVRKLVFEQWRRENQRKSLYLTKDNKIIMLGPIYNVMIDPDTMEISDIPEKIQLESNNWVYLGAFDDRESKSDYQFLPPAETSECIPLRVRFMEEDIVTVPAFRKEFHRESCP